jgi:hypothetical protein
MLPAQEVFYGIDDSWPITVRFGLMIAAAVGIYVGGKLVTYGLRVLQPTAEQLLARDPRLPVVLLRSFKDDDLTVPRKRYRKSALEWIPDPTVESGLARLLDSIGPVIAIGRPGEALQKLGSARAYVANAEWRQRIAEWMQMSRLVVMLVHHSTPGTHWELDYAVAHLPPERLALYFPSGREVGAAREQLYAAYKENLSGKFPKGLPPVLGSAPFVLFDSDWSPRAMETAHDLVKKFPDGAQHRRSGFAVLGPGGALLVVSIFVGVALELAYVVRWAVQYLTSE